MLEPRQLKVQHYCQLSSLSMEMGRTAKYFGGQYSHDIRGHRFRKDYEDHGTICLCQTEESATLYKHCLGSL